MTPAPASRAILAFRQDGFSLLEVLVAVTILGISFVTLFQSFSTGLGLAERTDIRTSAVIHARSVMDDVLAQKTLEAGSDSGRLDDRFDYRVNIEEIEPEEESEEPIFSYEVTVDVRWGTSGSISLTSQKTIHEEPKDTP